MSAVNISLGEWKVGDPHGSGLSDSVKQFEGKPYQEYCDVVARNVDGAVKLVCHVYQGNGGTVGSPLALREQSANAHLIAAAPEMLAVCVKLAAYGKAMCKQNMTEAEAEKAWLDLADAILDADAVIAKATGNATEPV